MRWLLLVVVSACGFSPATTDGRLGDLGGEMMGGELVGSEPAPPGCFGTGLGVAVCLAAMPSTNLDIPGIRIVNTNPGSFDCVPLTGATQNDYCVLAGTNVTIGGFLYASGSRPLVVLSLSTLDVTGTIDVGSHRLGSPQPIGPGGDESACNGTAASATTSAGFGGSFGSMGGDGGGTTPPDGQAGPIIAATSLRGGCPGGTGLDFDVLFNTGGHGGGVVDLIAKGSLSVLGKINASGSGGGGAGPTQNGGGGGGSGGMIVLDAPQMTFDNGATNIFANGGGGGGGSSNSTLTAGSIGKDPTSYTAGGNGGTGAGPVGGAGQPGGGNGAAGASTNTAAGNGADGPHGGGNGAGGGGYGVIRIFGGAPLPSTGHFSPTPS